VVGGKVSFGDALARFGVHAETLAASKSPTAAARAGYMSLLSPWDDATRAKMLETMTGIYELFLARIAEGRSTTTDKVAPFAEGRLFSGVQAKANGLIDELGGLHDAIERARALARLPADAEVTTITGHAGLLEQLASGGDGDDSASPVQHAAQSVSGAAAPIDAIAKVAPELVPFVTSLEGIVRRPGAGASEGALVALPYALILR
jgi:protease-4